MRLPLDRAHLDPGRRVEALTSTEHCGLPPLPLFQRFYIYRYTVAGNLEYRTVTLPARPDARQSSPLQHHVSTSRHTRHRCGYTLTD